MGGGCMHASLVCLALFASHAHALNVRLMESTEPLLAQKLSDDVDAVSCQSLCQDTFNPGEEKLRNITVAGVLGDSFLDVTQMDDCMIKCDQQYEVNFSEEAEKEALKEEKEFVEAARKQVGQFTNPDDTASSDYADDDDESADSSNDIAGLVPDAGSRGSTPAEGREARQQLGQLSDSDGQGSEDSDGSSTLENDDEAADGKASEEEAQDDHSPHDSSMQDPAAGKKVDESAMGDDPSDDMAAILNDEGASDVSEDSDSSQSEIASTAAESEHAETVDETKGSNDIAGGSGAPVSDKIEEGSDAAIALEDQASDEDESPTPPSNSRSSSAGQNAKPSLLMLSSNPVRANHSVSAPQKNVFRGSQTAKA